MWDRAARRFAEWKAGRAGQEGWQGIMSALEAAVGAPCFRRQPHRTCPDEILPRTHWPDGYRFTLPQPGACPLHLPVSSAPADGPGLDKGSPTISNVRVVATVPECGACRL